MKYSCYKCRYLNSDEENKPCKTCGKYVPARDGEGTVFMYDKWEKEQEQGKES